MNHKYRYHVTENVREETANVALSMILEEYGMPSVSLVQLGRDIPDVYLVQRGVRFILEMKQEGRRERLIEQMGDRLDDDACEVVFGIIFPSNVVEGGITAPSANQVMSNLRDAELTVLVQAISSDNDIEPNHGIRVAQIPELVTRYSGEALRDDELNSAVDRVSNAISGFSSDLARHQNVNSISDSIEEVLENGE